MSTTRSSHACETVLSFEHLTVQHRADEHREQRHGVGVVAPLAPSGRALHHRRGAARRAGLELPARQGRDGGRRGLREHRLGERAPRRQRQELRHAAAEREQVAAQRAGVFLRERELPQHALERRGHERLAGGPAAVHAGLVHLRGARDPIDAELRDPLGGDLLERAVEHRLGHRRAARAPRVSAARLARRPWGRRLRGASHAPRVERDRRSRDAHRERAAD
jgi:hypothetical protein